MRPRPLRHVDPMAPIGPVRRALLRQASSPLTSRISKTAIWRAMMWKLERALQRVSGGRLTAAPGLPVTLLETVGARSGQTRRTAVIYFHDGDAVVIVASQAGYPGNPSWYYNARAHPDVTLGGQPHHAAEVTTAAERERLWPLADRVFPAFATYRREAAQHGREVPLLRLTPVAR